MLPMTLGDPLSPKTTIFSTYFHSGWSQKL